MKGKKARRLLKKAEARVSELWRPKEVKVKAPTAASLQPNEVINQRREATVPVDVIPPAKPKRVHVPGTAASAPDSNFLDKYWNSSSVNRGSTTKRPLRYTHLFQNLESLESDEPQKTKLEVEAETAISYGKENVPDMSINSLKSRTNSKRLTFREVVDIIYHTPPINRNYEQRSNLQTDKNFGTWPPPRTSNRSFWSSVVADKPLKSKRQISATNTTISGSASVTAPKMQKLAEETDEPNVPVQNTMIESCLEFETLLRKRREVLVKKIEAIRKYEEQLEQIDKTLLEVEKQKSQFATFVDSESDME